MKRIMVVNCCADCPHSQHDIKFTDDDGKLLDEAVTVGGWCWEGSEKEGYDQDPPALTKQEMEVDPPEWCRLQRFPVGGR